MATRLSDMISDHRPKVPDPKLFIGKRIVKRMPSGEEWRGLVVKLLNYEGVNSMYKVQYDNGQEVLFRLIYDYIKQDLWFEEAETV